MSFAKIFKTASQNVKTTASRMIKEDSNFCCQMADLKISNGDSMAYPTNVEVDEWFNKLFSKDLKPKPLNEKALAAMAKKGIVPKKQPGEILLIVVAGSETHVHVGASVPEDMDLDIKEFVSSFLPNKSELVTVDNYVVASYKHMFPFKEIDNLQRLVFEELKKKNIYVEDEYSSDDEMVYDF